MGKGIMLQGTASNVGKSILAVALCRIFSQDGYNVNPFKSQNMSLNSYITPEGHEMGRAQVMQAEAAFKTPSVLMNPILLKPTSDRKSQIIFKGKVHKTMDAVDYFKYKPQLKGEIKEVYDTLANQSDIVVIEGAGSPAEINLNKNDFVNMGMAEMADAPVLLIGDIDKGGVFASLAGTMLLLREEEKKRVKGVIINKFRGSIEILEPGLRQLEEIINVPVLGVVPYFKLDLEEEDGVFELDRFTKNRDADIDIAIIRLPYMSNFTDFNALALYDDCHVRFVELEDRLGTPDLIIMPGSKTTIHDMKKLKESGMADQIIKASKKGSFVFGICGGYQMLGHHIHDPNRFETEEEHVEGLGLLPIETYFEGEKTTTLSEGFVTGLNEKVKGYEIHMGRTEILKYTSEEQKNKGITPLISQICDNKVDTHKDGFYTENMKHMGTYFHGIFDNGGFTRKYLNHIRINKGLEPIQQEHQDYWAYKDEQYNKLADIVRESLDFDKIYEILKG